MEQICRPITEKNKPEEDENFNDFWNTIIEKQEKKIKKPEYNPEYMFLNFNEAENYLYDYLDLRDNENVIK